MLRDFSDVTPRSEEIIEQPEQEPVADPKRASAPSSVWESKDIDDWTHEDLRDYVVTQIEKHFGRWPRDPRKEVSIFKSFHERWGTSGVLIAQAAFEVFSGWWHSSPVSVNRFSKGSDPYFAEVIMERLRDAATAS